MDIEIEFGVTRSLRNVIVPLQYARGVVFLSVDILSTVCSIVDYLSAVHCAVHRFYCHVTTIDKLLSHKVVDCHPIVIWAHLLSPATKADRNTWCGVNFRIMRADKNISAFLKALIQYWNAWS